MNVTKKSAAQPKPIRSPLAGRWSETALRVLNERYLLKDTNGVVIETPDEAMYRVAVAVAEGERVHVPSGMVAAEVMGAYAEEFYRLMASRKFMPNSPTLMNAGKDNGLQLSACYVVPVPDSLEGIFEAIKHAALIHKSGGGTGMSFSRLRAKNSRVGSTKGVSSGPVSFMKIFDAATEHIKQGGSRRGANMGVLRVDHPDIMEFIRCKLDGGVVNFNISVGVTYEFMTALMKEESYDLIDPQTKEVVAQRSAREVWDAIIDAAWTSGDPGLIFLDRVNDSPANPTPELEQIETTNPCGEQPLGSYDACNLGSLNLSEFVLAEAKYRQPPFAAREYVKWDELADAARLAVRFLDDVIEINPYPLPEVREKVRANRRIGLGVMGWADMLFKLGVRYDSDEAIKLGEEVMAHIEKWANEASRQLAKERGMFPNWEHSIYRDRAPIRNSNRTTVAPTGTISIIADCSSGIEPIFALAFQHRVKQPDGSYRVLDFVNPYFQAALDQAMWQGDAKSLVLQYVREHGSLAGLDWNTLDGWNFNDHVGMPKELAPFVTAQEIAPEWHIAMQAAFQKHVDSAISKTINLANSATRLDVESAYLQAWESGCLGITVFRDGCKNEQVLNVGIKKDEQPVPAPSADAQARDSREQALLRQIAVMEEINGKLEAEYDDLRVENKRLWVELQDLKERHHTRGYVGGLKPRSEKMHGYTRQVRAPEGKVNITLNSDADGLFEVFINIGRAGSDIAAMAEGLGRLISFTLRLDSPMSQNERAHEIARQLQNIGGSTSVGFGPQRISSLADAVSRAITLYLTEQYEPKAEPQEVATEDFVVRVEEVIDFPVTQMKATLVTSNGHNNGHSNGHSKTLTVALGNLCGSCGNSTLVLEEGCKKCLSCGYSAC